MCVVWQQAWGKNNLHNQIGPEGGGETLESSNAEEENKIPFSSREKPAKILKWRLAVSGSSDESSSGARG